MPCVAENGPFLHHRKILGVNYFITAGHRHEEISGLSRFLHGHYLKTVHNRFNRPYRVDFRHDYLSAQALCPHGNALAAPAITGYHNILSGYNQVGGTHHAIPYGLARTIPVIKKVLALCIVHTDHGEFQIPCLVHGFQTDNTCGCFLTAAQDGRNQLLHFRMHHVYQVAAVINNNVGACCQHRTDM